MTSDSLLSESRIKRIALPLCLNHGLNGLKDFTDYLSKNNNYPNLIRVICVFSDSDKKDLIVHIPFCLNHGLNGLKDFTDYQSEN